VLGAATETCYGCGSCQGLSHSGKVLWVDASALHAIVAYAAALSVCWCSRGTQQDMGHMSGSSIAHGLKWQRDPMACLVTVCNIWNHQWFINEWDRMWTLVERRGRFVALVVPA
jgi:hypothetical protein